jgi:hypothetical protein
MTNAVAWLLGQQDTTDPIGTGTLGGSWSFGGSYQTYSTGLALAALSYGSTVPTTPVGAVATAIANGRAFLENEFQAPPFETCTTTPSDPTSAFCGGWNYEPDPGRSDESNTGYAMTGLALTGGVPAAIQTVEVGWQNNDQSDTTSNPTYAGTRNDGGAGYQPLYAGAAFGADPFSSNANDSGTNLFSYGDDGITSSDARVQAALQFGTDVLDTYEKAAHSTVTPEHVMVYHTGSSEDGSCDPSAGGCDWAFDGDGGFHYSMFALSKGMGAFIPPNLSDGTNWYAKIADLLVNQQNTTAGSSFGSWPADGRDDYTILFATELSVFALGLVGVTPPPTTPADLNAVIQVETKPAFANDTVDISSSQLEASCVSVSYETLQGGSPTSPTVMANSIRVVLDGDGNVTVVVNGVDCDPGTDLIEADLVKAPYASATTILKVKGNKVTFPKVTGYPADEVETGNTTKSGHSDVYSVFYVETNPVYAGQTADISSSELVDRCGQGSRWESNATGSPFLNSPGATATIDDDGNAVFVFKGASCAAGTSTVIADVDAGSGTSYKTHYVIEPPQPTLTTTHPAIIVTASPNPLVLVGG